MNITLTDKDRVVYTYHGAPDQDVHEVKFVAPDPETGGTDDTYVVLWEDSEGHWNLAWKGDWKTAIGHFIDLTGDMDAGLMTARVGTGI